MRLSLLRPASIAATLLVSAGIMAAGLTIGPALASGGTFMVGPFAIVTCTSANPCQTYKNNGTGAGLKGQTAKGTGVLATATTTGTAVSATSAQGNAIYGVASGSGYGSVGLSNTGVGIYGSSSNYGVYGISSSTSGVVGVGGGASGVVGVSGANPGTYGGSTSGSGVLGVSSKGFGVEATSASSDAVHAVNTGTGPGIVALATSGYALYASTASGLGMAVLTSSGNGADISGTYIGIVGRAPAGTSQFPLVLTDIAGNNLFLVDGDGNVYYHGTLNNFMKTPRGDIALAYGSESSSPTVEDRGSGQLINGSAFVRLDPAFAQTIDGRTAYQVMLTPNGDTRGLYVAGKTRSGFMVREVQGGHASLAFDYHIYATPAGHANDRMMILPRAMPVHQRVAPSTRPLPLPAKIHLK
jgi:hypothetical protein